MLRNKKGISPIVGVILVVAMTVLLAAIAWTYMSGMVSNPGKTYIVQPVVTKENPDRVVVRFEGKDVSEIYKVDFSGSTNGTGGKLVWILYNNSKLIWHDRDNNVSTTLDYSKLYIAIKNATNTTAFTFGETTIPGPTTTDNGKTIKTTETLIPSFKFIGKIATPEAQSNTIMITITFKDGTTQSFQYKI